MRDTKRKRSVQNEALEKRDFGGLLCSLHGNSGRMRQRGKRNGTNPGNLRVKETENENLPDQGGASDSTEGTVNGVTDRDSKEESEDREDKEDGRDDGEDLTDRAGDAGKDLIDGAGDAGKDLIDGVGDAGKDVIDGVEDAGDALTNP